MMKALILEQPGKVGHESARAGPLRLVETPRPEPGPGDLLLRVRACAVCRTDLQLAEGDLAAHRLPIIPGHQAVGRVEAIGANVPRLPRTLDAGSWSIGAEVTGLLDPDSDAWSIGDRAAVTWLAGACGDCPRCREGRENLCATATFTGWDRDGGFAEWLTVRADVAVHVPDRFSDVDAAPLLCGGVIGYRALRIAGVQSGGRLGLFGFGASARLAIQVARHQGCEVFAWARSERDRERARDLGAAWTGNHGMPTPAPLDGAITFAPSGDVVVEALRAVDRGGTVAINAIHLDRIPEFPYEALWWERSLRSVANVTRRDARDFLAIAAQIGITTEPEPMPLADGNAALERIASGRVSGAVVLTMP